MICGRETLTLLEYLRTSYEWCVYVNTKSIYTRLSLTLVFVAKKFVVAYAQVTVILHNEITQIVISFSMQNRLNVFIDYYITDAMSYNQSCFSRFDV